MSNITELDNILKLRENIITNIYNYLNKIKVKDKLYLNTILHGEALRITDIQEVLNPNLTTNEDTINELLDISGELVIINFNNAKFICIQNYNNLLIMLNIDNLYIELLLFIQDRLFEIRKVQEKTKSKLKLIKNVKYVQSR